MAPDAHRLSDARVCDPDHPPMPPTDWWCQGQAQGRYVEERAGCRAGRTLGSRSSRRPPLPERARCSSGLVARLRSAQGPIKVGDVDCELGKLVLRDTKNRSDHKLLLSRQALEIAARNCSGRKPEDPLFPIVDARKTLAWINAQAGTTVQGHGLRATFASVAEELVSGGALKRMPNHATGGDAGFGVPRSTRRDCGSAGAKQARAWHHRGCLRQPARRRPPRGRSLALAAVRS